MPSQTSTADDAPPTISAREAQRLETRARLFDAAVAEIGRSGLAGADVSTIASTVGVSRGTFYFHFPTKEHVVVAVELAEEVKIVGPTQHPAVGADRPVVGALASGPRGAGRRAAIGSGVVSGHAGVAFLLDSPSGGRIECASACRIRDRRDHRRARRGTGRPGQRRRRARGVLPHRAVRVAGHRQEFAKDTGCSDGSVCEDDRSREWRHDEQHRNRRLPGLLGATRRRRRSAQPAAGQPRGVLRGVRGGPGPIETSHRSAGIRAQPAPPPSRTRGRPRRCSFCWPPPS